MAQSILTNVAFLFSKLIKSRNLIVICLSFMGVAVAGSQHWFASLAALTGNETAPALVRHISLESSKAAVERRNLSIGSPVPICTPPAGLIISEFRLRGPNGVNDEFIEFYNNTDQSITVCTADGSNGWALVSSDGLLRFIIPVDTVIPARAHYLAVGSGYSLASYAAGDLNYIADIPDNLGLALFNTASAINFTIANRLDAVGFTTTVNSLYREANGLPTLMTTNGQHSFVRKLNSGFPQDTGDNAADFTFIAADGGNYGVIAILGAPGPEGLSSPIQRNAQLPVIVLDAAVGANVAPNRVRDTTAIGPNAAAGTLTMRRKITNNTSGAVTRLRVRIVDITTLNTPGYVPGGTQADMRALSSNDTTVALSNGTQVLVRGTTVEAPPQQPNGGGLNSSLGVFAFSLSQPLAPGASTNVQFVLGVQQPGTFRFFINVEAIANSLPSAIAGGPYSGPTGSPVQFNGSSSYDLEGPVDSYQWNFGDNTFGSGPAPAHTYNTAGTYTVTLTVADNTGLTTSGTTTATIYPASNKLPVANIAGPYSAVTSTATQFSASGSFDPDGSITQYRWDFAGLGTGTGATPTFTFTKTGTHLVSLTVTDNVGAKTLASINVTVSVPPGGEQLNAADPTVSEWDPVNRRSLDDPTNDRGNLANKATGNNNFQIVAPVLSLPGRGVDLNLNLVYNSLVWNKSGTDMYFDIDHDSPAPGWHLGFGKMVNLGTAGCMLIEPDGSRHPFKGTVFNYHYNAIGSLPAVDIPVFKGETTDGSMIEYRCEPPSWQNPSGVARYPNGTVVFYTNLSSGSQARNYLYPTRIVDKNGNSITILYTWPDAEPRIQRIVDSVGRVINFRYDTQKRLTSITGPGLKDANGNPTTQTFVRLHYTTLTLGLGGAFTGATHVRNSSPFVIDAIYYPATGNGYFFGTDAYSSYGMLWKVKQQRGMSFSPAANPDEQGTITEGTVTRTQTYDYQKIPSNLASAPAFNKITETWDGGIAATETNFSVQENAATSERTVTVTNPDGTKTVQIAFSLNNLADSDANKFKNGLTKEERKVGSNGTVIQKTVFTWEQGANGTPRLQRTETTDERGQVLATAYDQYGDNNGIGRTRELDYSGAVRRTTVNTFLSYLDGDLDQGIDRSRGLNVLIHPRLVNLVTSTKLFQGDNSANALASFAEFKFDEYAETLKAYPADGESSLDLLISGLPHPSTGIIGILQHVAQFNPSPRSTTNLNGGFGADYFTKRGNVTSITRYADTSNAASPASPIVEKMKYDMAGNVIASSRICCEELSSNFDDLAAQYAFPISQTRGSADPDSLLRVTTSASYDLSTGLPLLVKDANGRPTQTTYFSTSLRPQEIILPTGARIVFEYDDAAMKAVETRRLSVNGAIASQTTRYFNGLGQIKKEEALGANGVIDIVETVYDQFGRPSKQSLPYRSGQTPQWRETVYDPAGRVAEHREPPISGTFQNNENPYPATKYFYNEATPPLGASNEPGQTTRTVDAWERWRWVRLDAAGRLAEVVEPNPAGGSGFQTKYSYDALNKLVRVEQGDPQQGVQVRRFRYDSLGRLTHQKLAETEATLNLSGQWSTAGTANDRWSEVFTYDERSNLISKTDARGVKTIFRYKDSNNVDDPLNRLQSVSYDLSGVPGSLTVLPAPTVTYQYQTKASTSTLIDVTQVRQVVAAGVSTEDYDYDGEGRVNEKRLTFAGRSQPMTTSYAYDALSRITQTTYPQQYRDNIANPLRKAVIPSYDTSSRLSGLKVNNADYASQITYNAASQITSLFVGSGPNQLTETNTYEERTNLLSTQSVKRGTTTLMSYSYGYLRAYCDVPGAACDADPKWDFHTGQLTKVWNNGPIGEWKNQKFYYDELGRLKTAEQYTWIQNPKPPEPTGFEWHKRVYWTQNYSYDRYGNRTAVAASTNTASPIVADGFQALSFDPASNRITTAGFAYDSAGNQTQNNSGQSFVYDAAGRLAKVKNLSGATLATYTYGASNRRLITQTGSESSTDKTYYIWEGNSVIAEYVEQTSATMPKWSRNYIYLGGRLLATEAPNGSGEIVHYHHTDRLGTKLVTNNLDTTSFHQANLPFGVALEAESTSGITSVNNRRFTSYDRSATTGLDYAVNRQYDSRQGRFTQVDPLGMGAASLADPQSLNMYSYVGNDPVNRIDPDGQFWGALFRFIAGLFTSLKPNVINGSFTYRNAPPISVSFTPNFQNIGVGFAGIGFNLRSNGNWLPEVLGLSNLLDPQTDTVSYTGPCPPTGDELAANKVVKDAIHETSKKADEFRDTWGYWIEHGGWIFWNPKTRKIATYMKRPATSPPFAKDYPYLDTAVGVYLDYPPPNPAGWLLVGKFHVHVEDSWNPETDGAAANRNKVPGLVGTPNGTIYVGGSYKRGLWNSDLPERCRERKQ
jgi:RHS repeat-associated protein